MITWPSAPGARDGVAGSADRTAWRVAGVCERRNGETPSTAAYSTTPSDQRSEAGPGCWPRTRSGAMNSGEPTNAPVSVSPCSPSTWAMPKSVRTTRSPLPSSTLSGLTSRCRTPASWAASSAPRTARPILAASRASRVPSWRRSPSEWPVTSSMTTQGLPSSTTTSCTVTTAGCSIRAAARASRCIRRYAFSRSASLNWSGSRGSLTATARCTTRSKPRQTVPIPPCPSRSSSRYRPPTTRPAPGPAAGGAGVAYGFGPAGPGGRGAGG